MKETRSEVDSSRRIAVIARNLRFAGGLSVGRSIVGTLPQFTPNVRYLMVVPADCGYPKFPDDRRVEVCECPKMSLPQRWLWERRTLRRVISRFDPEWIWTLGNVAVSRPPCKQSLLLHNAHRLCDLSDVVRSSLRERLFKWLSDERLQARARGQSVSKVGLSRRRECT